MPTDRAIDGLSLVAHLNSGGTKALARNELTWHFLHCRGGLGPYGIIRDGRWKLIRFLEEGRDELHDLEADPGEAGDLAARQPSKVRALAARLAKSLDSMGAKQPRPNPA